jgi:hypothetical protein
LQNHFGKSFGNIVLDESRAEIAVGTVAITHAKKVMAIIFIHEWCDNNGILIFLSRFCKSETLPGAVRKFINNILAGVLRPLAATIFCYFYGLLHPICLIDAVEKILHVWDSWRF